jgi:lysophospholipase L1-like esterase
MKLTLFALPVLILVSCSTMPNCSKNHKHIPSAKQKFFNANHEFIKYYGRVHFSDPDTAVFAFPGVNIRFDFKGTDVSVRMKDLTDGAIQADGNPAKNFFNIYIDTDEPFLLSLSHSDSIYLLAEGLNDVIHSVRLVKRTESLAGKVAFMGVIFKDSTALYQVADPELKIEFIGNSITCGYGVEAANENAPFSCNTENAALSYAVLSAEELNAEYSLVAFSGRGISQNYDRSRENTMPVIWREVFADQPQPEWDHSAYLPDLIVINLGTNDFYSGTIDTALFRSTYKDFITEIRTTYPDASIVCLVGPMLNNDFPADALNTARRIIGSIVDGYVKEGDSTIYLFELSAQTGELGFGADWHPSEAQQRKNARELTGFLKRLINK